MLAKVPVVLASNIGYIDLAVYITGNPSALLAHIGMLREH